MGTSVIPVPVSSNKNSVIDEVTQKSITGEQSNYYYEHQSNYSTFSNSTIIIKSNRELVLIICIKNF